MKKQTIVRALMAAVIVVGSSATADAQLGKLKGLGNKVKDTAKEKVENKVKEKVPTTPSGVVNTAVDVARGTAPWPMNGEEKYKGMTMEEFVYNIASLPQDEIESLRDAMLARFSANMDIINKAPKTTAAEKAAEENSEMFGLYNWLDWQASLALKGVEVRNHEVVFDDDRYCNVSSPKGGIFAFIFGQTPDVQRFSDNHGNGIYLNEQNLAAAKDMAERFHRYTTLSKGFYKALEEKGWKHHNDEDKILYYRTLLGRCSIVASALDNAIAKNSPANIDRQPRPSSGSMEASLKSQALAVAKAKSDKVIDVIIKSDSWDVKKKGGVPTHRSVYGYWILKDEQGNLCVPRMWTESYEGNGKYGKLRVGGAGLEEPFYLK